MTTPTSAAELLAKLREGNEHYPFSWTVTTASALSLLTAWRDEAVRAERERSLRIAEYYYANVVADAIRGVRGLYHGESAALQERPNE